MDEGDKPVRAIVSWMLDGRQELLLREGDCVEVGREQDNDLVLPGDHISRKHAIIVWRKDHFEVEDLRSANGTTVNGKPLNKPRVLKDGDRLAFFDVETVFNEHRQAQPPMQEEGVRRTIIMKQPARPSLVISSGPGEGHKIPLKEGVMTIGRATSSGDTWDISLQDRSVSRPHARVETKEGVVNLTDAGSANGTLLNGNTLSSPAALKDGDVITIGETILIFRAAVKGPDA
ncbi:MAG TPA: FHA domain-containing protein [Anaerolineales bacterium]|nr:FHA domain-containing protein [Anaerolineales bacterium]